MTPWRHRLRRLRFIAGAVVAVVLIGAAVVMGLVQLLLPLAMHYPQFVANELSATLHRPVEFQSVSGEWQPSGPLLMVRDLTLGPARPGGQSITLSRASLKLDFGAWLHPAHRWITLRVQGAELRVVHTAAGWQVAGFGEPGGRTHVALQSLPIDLDLRNLQVDIVDSAGGHDWHLVAPRLRVVNGGGDVRFGGFVRERGTRQAVRIAGRMNIASRDYSLYLATRDMDFAAAMHGVDLHGYVVHSGRGDVELWGQWQGGKLKTATAQYALRALHVTAADGHAAAIPVLAGVFKAGRAGGGWNLAWRGPGGRGTDIDDTGGLIAYLSRNAGKWRVTAAARSIDIAAWLELLALAPQTPQSMAGWVRKAGPHAHIDSAALQWRGPDRFKLVARVSGIGAAAVGKVPGLALAHAVVRGDADAFSVQLQPQAATLAITDVFRKPFVLTKLGGAVAAWREGGHWHIGTSAVHFKMGSITGSLEGQLTWLGPGRRPLVAAYATITQARVPDAKRFWTWRTMPPKLIEWLDRALVAGNVTSGRVLVRGDLDDWPFTDHKGRFEATGHAQDATFDFSDRWPHATGVDAVADFVDDHMRVEASHLTVRGVTVSHATATIPDMHQAVLGLDASGASGAAAMLDLVRHSPVAADAGKALTGLSLHGDAKFAIKLSIPLDHADEFALRGRVNLAGVDASAKKWKLALKDVTGPLLIDGKGFVASRLAAKFRDSPARLSLAVGSGVKNHADIFEASLDTTASAQALARSYPQLAGLVKHAHGVAPFHIGLRVLAAAHGAPASPILDVQSPLAGIALDWPAPLSKPARTELPLDLHLRLPPGQPLLTVSLGKVLQIRGRLPGFTEGTPPALAINLGATMPASVPAKGIVVRGHAQELDLGGWLQQAFAGTAGFAFPVLTAARVGSDDIEVFGVHLGPMRLGYTTGAKTAEVNFSGPVASGSVQLPVSGLMAHGITAQFTHLYWPRPPKSKPAQTAVPPPPPTPPPVTSPIAPTAVPPLHVTIADLRVGDLHLGAATLDTAPTSSGMHVSRLDTNGKDFTIHLHGDWDGTRQSSDSHFQIDFSTQSLGATLAGFGIKGPLAGGRGTQIHANASWPGPPSSFEPGWLQGSLKLAMGEGRILGVQPGLGRVLGLISLRALPSRLSLDFSDVFKSGFGFKQMQANFAFRQGSAYTQDLQIKAPAAQLKIRGRIGLRTHDLDLVVTAVPHIGATLPVIGAVIGGPLGAAAGLVMQGLFHRGINRVADRTYRVTGSWDEPDIVNLKSVPAAAPSAPASSSAGASVRY